MTWKYLAAVPVLLISSPTAKKQELPPPIGYSCYERPNYLVHPATNEPYAIVHTCIENVATESVCCSYVVLSTKCAAVMCRKREGDWEAVSVECPEKEQTDVKKPKPKARSKKKKWRI